MIFFDLFTVLMYSDSILKFYIKKSYVAGFYFYAKP